LQERVAILVVALDAVAVRQFGQLLIWLGGSQLGQSSTAPEVATVGGAMGA
jgi:hypothetical protein